MVIGCKAPSRLTTLLLLLGLALTGCMRSPEQKYARFMEQGKMHNEQGDYASAALEFRNAARVMPSDGEALFSLAQAELRNGRLEEAVQAARKAEQVDPDNMEVKMFLARVLVLAAEDDALQFAQERLEQVLTRTPSDSNALFLLAATKARVGSGEEVEKLLQEALKYSPSHLESRILLAKRRLAEKDFEGAEKVLVEAVNIGPESVAPKLALGQLYLLLQRWQDAETQFRNALNQEPQRPEAMVGLALAREREGQPDEAERLLQEVASLPDKRFRSYYGRILAEHGKRDAAVAEFKRVAEQDPADLNARALLISAFLAEKLPADAEAFLKSLLERDPKDRDARGRLVGLYLGEKRMQEARDLLSKAIEENPKDVDALLQRTEINWRSGVILESEDDIQKVLEIRPTSFQVHYFLAKLHQAQKKAELYQQELNETIRLNPSFLPARVDLADLLRRSGETKAALNVLDEAPAESKRVLPFTLARNWVLMQLGNDAEVRQVIDQALKVTQHPELLLQDGMVKLAQKDYDAARVSLQRVLEINPENTQALMALAQSYTAQKQEAAATEVVKKHVASKPESAALQYFLGTWQMRAGQRGEARAAFQAAIAGESSFFPAYLKLAQLEVTEGRYDAAREALKPVLEGDPNNVVANLYAALNEESAKNYDAAVAYYRKVIEAEPDHAVALNNLAYRLAAAGKDLDEALRFAQRAKETAPGNPSIDDTIGWLYYLKGLYPSALPHLESAASSKQGKENALVHYHLAMAHFRLGNIERAQQAFRAAEALNADLPEGAEARRLLAKVTNP